MRFIKTIFSLFIIICLCQASAWAQQDKSSTRSKKRPSPAQTTVAPKAKNSPRKKSPARRDYKELHLGFSMVSGRLSLDVGGEVAKMRSQLQGLSLTYTFYKPSKNIMWLYSYGFGGTLGMAKASPDPYQTPFTGFEVKNKTWFMGSFLPGIDYRRSHRARVGIFAPVMFRILDFGYDKNEAKLFDNDPFSVGLGFRYINAINNKNSVSFSFAHQFVWSSSTWELVWQRRLGI